MDEFSTKDFEALGIVLRIPKKGRRALMEGRDQLTPQRKKPSGGGGSSGGRSRIGRIARRAPEVMVKISGGAQGFKHLREHLNYITRNGVLVAETPSGEVFGRGDVSDTASAWWSNRGQAQGRRRANSRETVNLVLSMPAGTDRDKFLAGARAFASRTFAGNHDYLLVEHRDTQHPHVHLTVRTLGHDMTRLQRKKADLQAWREGLALELRGQGLAAEATPRRARGVVRKSRSQALTHLDTRGESLVQRAKIAEAVREVGRKVSAGEWPWEAATKRRQGVIRDTWNRLAKRLEIEGGEGAELAGDIRQFIATMPAIETERDALQRVVRGALRETGSGGRDAAPPKEPGEPER